jgi:hypothetical protein
LARPRPGDDRDPNTAWTADAGTMGLGMELWNPGAIFPSVVGAIHRVGVSSPCRCCHRPGGLLLLLVGSSAVARDQGDEPMGH